ncbi:MAG: SGNH/GDSL hydrolase family protein [Planctomycetia bacterium]|nr:SGNH/GDSL hydrolase family protein [Planctomycetia bacterium]
MTVSHHFSFIQVVLFILVSTFFGNVTLGAITDNTVIDNTVTASSFTAGTVTDSAITDGAGYQIRNGIPNSLYYFRLNQTGNQYLFYVGGDLLDGVGLSNPNHRWSVTMSEAFRKHFPDSSIIETRHSQPLGSWFAQYRTSGGQAVFGEVICSGHLAILELATGDRGMDIRHVRRQVEGLVRQINMYRSTHSTILVYALTPELLEAYLNGNEKENGKENGKEPENIEECEKIADYYGIPSLNLAKIAAREILSGKIALADFTQDGVHPTDAGQKIYDAAIRDFVDALVKATPIPDAPTRVKLPEKLWPETNPNGRIVAYERTQFSDGWQGGQESPLKPFRHLLVTEKAGETLTLKFHGTDVGLIDVTAADTMKMEFSLDGQDWKPIPAPKVDGETAGNVAENAENTEYFLRAIPLEVLLSEETEHTLVLRTCGGGMARIGGILVNGTVQNPYDGMSALEKIDAIYAQMDPIQYTPENDRFRYIPEAIKRLQNGDSLRIVLLGDSIMGNTSASMFDLLLGRMYPKCKIEKIASLRSSTGCNWYQHENRVQSYVIDKKPDLLIIGGISNGQDPEAVRSVIRQVRAQRPDQEILFITPVFGALRDDHISRWSYEPAEGTFRAGMKKVCEEEKCAFFDMTAPWWKYVTDSGKTYGWFMGDAVHANERGCQIIGRLLEIYFDVEK